MAELFLDESGTYVPFGVPPFKEATNGVVNGIGERDWAHMTHSAELDHLQLRQRLLQQPSYP